MSSGRDARKIVDPLEIMERNIDKKALIMIDREHGFEGTLSAVSRLPPGIWLSAAEAVVFRTTLANPLPQIVSRHKRSEIFINLSSIQRLEILEEE